MPADRLFHPRLGHSERVNQLSHLEYRVWSMYELTADDFGVMRFSAITIQAACDALENTPKAEIMAALERIAAVGLITVFEHQGRQYCCQLDWQNWQRVKYPRDTMQPIPPPDVLEQCTPMTRKLFEKHTSLREEPRQRSDDDRKTVVQRLENNSPTIKESAPETLRLTANANGERLTKGVQGESRLDQCWHLLINGLYPKHRVSRHARASHAFVDAMNAHPDGPAAAWALFTDNLQANIASHEWRVKGMIPFLEKYITEGRWQSVLPADAPVGERLSSKTNRTMQGAAEALAEAKRSA